MIQFKEDMKLKEAEKEVEARKRGIYFDPARSIHSVD
jgi:hypothetical protein